MSKTSASVVIDYQLVSRFNAIREKLLSLDPTSQWDEPLAYWAQATDRHLPMVLIDKTLRWVLNTPFQQIIATPGVGPKKLSSLIMLMTRAAEGASAAPAARVSHADARPPAADAPADPAAVSESVWRQWRASVQSQQLEKEMLGRFAASLQQLPRAMWQKRLDYYLPLSLREIRGLKSHGQKRVKALLEIVGDLHGIIAQLQLQPHLSAQIEPRLAARLERWVARCLQGREPLDDAALCRELFEPLLEQIAIDVGEQAAGILRERLLEGRSNIQQTARRLGLTRGRVYEIISEAAIAIAVRWPTGRQRLVELRDYLERRPERQLSLTRIESALALLFADYSSDGVPETQSRETQSAGGQSGNGHLDNGPLGNGRAAGGHLDNGTLGLPLTDCVAITAVGGAVGEVSFAPARQVSFGAAEIEG